MGRTPHVMFAGIAALIYILGGCGGGGGGSGSGGGASPPPPPPPPPPLGSGVGLTAGWATFGLAVPAGLARDGFEVEQLPTQTDVKSRWPDGSIRFAIVTAKSPATALYQIRPAAAPMGGFTPSLPAVSVRFNIGGTIYTAALPSSPSADRWLAGPLVIEHRSVVAPVRGNGTPHGFLTVVFDVRCYSDGAARIDVAVENCLDIAGATSVTYDVTVTVQGVTAFQKSSVTHPYLTRWRKVFGAGLTEAAVAPDLTPFYAAAALPRYLALVENMVDSPTGATFEILGSAGLEPYMPAHAGREELAPYPDWAARYLVHRDPTQRSYVLANGDLAGSWPVHLREPVGGTYAGVGSARLVSIDERPDFWLDGRAEPQNRPAGNLAATGPLVPDNAHVPSLAYIPYLLTGDRYYAEEMAFWANFGLLFTFQDSFSNARGGAEGLLGYNEVRGFAWVLRNMVDACAYLPDGDAAKAYFADKIANNLAWLDDYVATHPSPLGTLWIDKRPENSWAAPKVWIATWEQNYLAWAIDRAAKQGFSGGLAHRDAIAAFQLGLFTHHPDYDRAAAGEGVIAIGEDSGSGVQFYSTYAEVYAENFPPGSTPRTFAGYYGVDARLMLMIALDKGLAGAQTAYDYLWPFLAVDPFYSGLTDLGRRAGWAIARPNEP